MYHTYCMTYNLGEMLYYGTGNVSTPDVVDLQVPIRCCKSSATGMTLKGKGMVGFVTAVHPSFIGLNYSMSVVFHLCNLRTHFSPWLLSHNPNCTQHWNAL